MKLSNRMFRKIPMFALFATSVFAGPLARGAWIDESAAMHYVIPKWSSGFPYFLQFKFEFGNKELMI